MGDTLSVEYFPHHKQKDFHSSKAKFRLICTGVGFGKSAAGVNELIIQAMSAKAGCQFVMIAPTFRMLKNATLREFFKFCPHELVKKYNRSDNTIQLINDTEIICLSGDNERDLDRIRGLNIGGAYGDEVALCPEYLHDILVARLRDARGSLKLWYTTTPKGFNWLYRLFFEKKRKDNTYLDDPHDYEIFGGKTRDNPYTPKEYKKAMESLYVGAFAKQELEGSFIGFEGLVYKNFSADVHIIDSKDFHPVRLVAGIDWGFTNPQVYLLCGVDSDDRVCVLKEFYESQIQMTQFIDVVKSINASFTKKYHDNGVTGVDCCYADPSEPRYIAKLNSEGIRTQAANNDIMPGINQIFSRLETMSDNKPRLFIDKSCLQTINEFKIYRYPDKKEGFAGQEKPIKAFDHAMDALRYVCNSLELKNSALRSAFGRIKKHEMVSRKPREGALQSIRKSGTRFKDININWTQEKAMERVKSWVAIDRIILEEQEGVVICDKDNKIWKPLYCYGCDKKECKEFKRIVSKCGRVGVKKEDVWERQKLYEVVK